MKRVIVINAVIFCLILGTLFCTKHSSNHSVQIIPVYKGMEEYVMNVRNNPELDLDTLFYHALLPYWNVFVQNKDPDKEDKKYFFKAISNFESLDSLIVKLKNSDIKNVILNTYEASNALLPSKDTRIALKVEDPENTFVRDMMHGIMGYTMGDGLLVFTPYPTEGWLKNIPRLFAHEYHHSVCFNKFLHEKNDLTLLEAITVEGRASSFAQLIAPEGYAPHTKALTKKQELYQWNAMQTVLYDTSNAILKKYLFGGDNTPRWTGYTIGFNIVQSFIKNNPEVGIEEWTFMEADELLEKSGYLESLSH